MVWKPYRLRKDWQFRNIIVEEGQKIFNSSFTIFFTTNNYNNCRFGISTPMKLVKLATDRNFYKRQVKSMLISRLKEGKKVNSCQTNAEHSHSDLVIIIRHPYLKNDFVTNQKNLYKLIDLVDRMRGKPNGKN